MAVVDVLGRYVTVARQISTFILRGTQREILRKRSKKKYE